MTMINTTIPNVQVGQGCAVHGYSDVDPYTVIRIERNGRTLVLQEAKAELMNGVNSGAPDALQFSPGGFVGHTSGRQRWTITPDPEGHVKTATLRKDGRYYISGTATGRNGNLVTTDGYRKHYDFNF